MTGVKHSKEFRFVLWFRKQKRKSILRFFWKFFLWKQNFFSSIFRNKDIFRGKSIRKNQFEGGNKIYFWKFNFIYFHSPHLFDYRFRFQSPEPTCISGLVSPTQMHLSTCSSNSATPLLSFLLKTPFMVGQNDHEIDAQSPGPFAPPFPRSLPPLTHSLAPHCPHCSRASLRSFACSLTRSLAHSVAYGKEVFVYELNVSISCSFNPL